MQPAVFCCAVVLTSLCTFSNSMIPLHPRALIERVQEPSSIVTTTESFTTMPGLALRKRDIAASRKKDKNDDCTEKGQPHKPNKDGKIVNTGEIEKQIIVNIENHLMPEFKIDLGSGMLRNLICGNFSITCQPEYTTPQCEPPTKKPVIQKTTKWVPQIRSSTVEDSIEETDIITASDSMDESTESVEHSTKPEKPRRTTPDIVLTISLPHDNEDVSESDESEEEHYTTSKKPRSPKPPKPRSEQVITVEYSVQTIADDSEETTEPYTKKTPTRKQTTTTDTTIEFSVEDKTTKYQKPITRKPVPVRSTRGTTRRPTRTKRPKQQPKPRRTTATEIITIGRETTKCRWPKGTTRGTTELTAEISQSSFQDETEETTENMKPTTRRRTTKPLEEVTAVETETFPESDESTTEMSESTESNESIETCEPTEPPESTEPYSSNESETEPSESQSEPEEPDYDDSEPSDEDEKPRKTTLKPSRLGKIITKLNCTDLFPPSGNRKPKRIRKRDLYLTELLRLRCLDEVCKQCENCESNLKEADNTRDQNSKVSSKEKKDVNETKRNEKLIPLVRERISEKVSGPNAKLKFPSNEDISRKLERLQRSVHHVNLNATFLPSLNNKN